MNEEQGLSIENNKEDTKTYLIFRITGMKTVQFEYLSVSYRRTLIGRYKMKQKILTADSVRLVVGNKETGEVYFNKLYKSVKK